MSFFKDTNDLAALDLSFSPYVFVYGTLKSGFGNNQLLSTSEYVGEAITKKKGELRGYGIPFFVPEEFMSGDYPARSVKGEVWKIDNLSTLFTLDRLEGHPYFYYRSPILVDCVPLDQDEPVEMQAWCYFYIPSKNTGPNEMLINHEGQYEWP